ncbi:MAG TPA: thiamine pyrophosphate-dependent dehydrogenase E1 component subunit alpha [Candidatus Dormibacteraeota bacterium]|nr:thiamine pyrophosphate-dependent dehydrogenase E1 component subunit alpha [Candidatus Dormibacteraeota bacterium]
MALKTTEVEAKGGRSRHRSLGLSDEQALRIYEVMRLARAVDERMWLINRQGRAPFVISCQGQEGAQVGIAAALRTGYDWVAPYYRDAGVVLWFGMTARDQMLSFFARREDPNSGGRQMPGHFGNRRLHIVTGGSPVATQLLHAAGVALASKQRKEDAVTAAFFGEGAASQGDTHEAMNFAGIHKLAVVFVCENNGYAISVPQSHQMAIENVADRAAGYGFPGVVVDGNDVLACYEAARQAVDRARRGEGPTLIEVKTYRFTAHSSDDDDKRYRPAAEVAIWRQKDPIQRYATYLRDAGILTDPVEEEVTERVTQQVDEATEYAEEAPDPSADDLTTFVYKQEIGP